MTKMKVLIIGGMPGTGKTTLMKKWMEKYTWEPHLNDIKLVPYYRSGNLLVLGKYEEGEVFGGTDKMSMAVQPAVIEWFYTLTDTSTVVLEGDRLFTQSFLDHCVENYDTKIFILTADKELLSKRYEQRGSNQDPVWLKGRESKVNNVRTNLMLMDNILCFQHENEEDTANIVDNIEHFVRN